MMDWVICFLNCMKDFYGLKVEEDEGVFLLFLRLWEENPDLVLPIYKFYFKLRYCP